MTTDLLEGLNSCIKDYVSDGTYANFDFDGKAVVLTLSLNDNPLPR